ncbi:MAG: hypothetical protein H0U86_13870 [Chloroflexi bacterium]|nr:hypothetical protein [Chloroflexota bacterium]
MSQVRQAAGAFPPVAIHYIAAVAAALLIAGIVALSAFGFLNVQLPPVDDRGVSPTVLEAGREWEIQRRAQSGYIEPVIQSSDDWEEQRRQQSPF